MRFSVFLLAVVSLTGCGSSGGGGTQTFLIELKGTGASPQNLSVPSGAQVTFANHDSVNHQVGSSNCTELTSGALLPNTTFVATLGTGPKSCNYSDTLNPSAASFQGSLSVAAPTGPGH